MLRVLFRPEYGPRILFFQHFVIIIKQQCFPLQILTLLNGKHCSYYAITSFLHLQFARVYFPNIPRASMLVRSFSE